MVNKVQLIGNVGQDPEIRTTPNGNMVANFSVATNRRWKDAKGELQEQTQWHNVACWGKLAEIVRRYVEKGRQVYVEGRLQTDRVERDGSTFFYTKVVAHTLKLLGRRPDEDGEAAAEDAEAEAPAAAESIAA